MPTMKNGRVELVEINTPNVTIPPGGSFEVEMVLKNHESFIFNDPDRCSNAGTPCTGKDGYCISVNLSAGGGSEKKVTNCLNLPFSGIPPNTERWRTVLTAPNSEGSHTVTAYAEAPASGSRTSTVSSNISVSEQTVGGGRNDDQGGGSGGNGGGGGSGGTGGGPGSGGGFLQFAMENPLVAGVGSVAAIVAVREGTSALIGGDE